MAQLNKFLVFVSLGLAITAVLVKADVGQPKAGLSLDDDDDLHDETYLSTTSLVSIATAKQGFAEMLELYAEENFNLNTVTHQGVNLVLISVLSGRSREDLELLLDYGVSWNISDKEGSTVLHYAASGGNLDALNLFLSLGADIEAKDMIGNTPIFRIASAKENFSELLVWFSENGANVHAVGQGGNNLAILTAGEERSTYELNELVKLGVNWKATNKKEQGVMHYAAAAGKLKTLKFYRSLGADIDARDIHEKTPLLRIMESGKNFLELFNWFVTEGADLNAVDENGNNLILLCIVKGKPKHELEQMVKAGMNWNIKNSEGQTVLHYSAAFGNFEALKYFKSLGADINARDNTKSTPLIRSAEADINFLEMLAWLIKEGADLQAVDNKGVNVLVKAVTNGKSIQVLKQIVRHGVPWNDKNMVGFTILHFAASRGNLDALKYFESLGADIDARCSDGRTPVLMTALSKDNFLEMLTWFEKHGAEMDVVDNDGDNLVFAAVSTKKSVKEIEQILKYGVPWNIKNKKGQSVVHAAAANGNVEALKYFKALKQNSSSQTGRSVDEL